MCESGDGKMTNQTLSLNEETKRTTINVLEAATGTNAPDALAQNRIYPLVCIFGCTDPVVAVLHTPEGCTCALNKYQPRCMQHLMRLGDTDEGNFKIVEDFRMGENWP
jgi:hypothetical protein